MFSEKWNPKMKEPSANWKHDNIILRLKLAKVGVDRHVFTWHVCHF